MIIESIRPALAVGVGFIAALTILFFGNKIRPNLREAVTMIASVIMAGLVFSMVPEVLAGNVYVTHLWNVVDGIELTLRTDSAAMVFACVSSGLWILTSVYSIGYVRGHNEKNQTGYFAAFATCLGAAIGIALSANLITFFVFYEILTIATYPLVCHYRDDKAKASGRKYLAYTLISGQIFFAAILFIYVKYGTLDFVAGGFINPETMSQGVMCILFFMMLVSGAVKAGVMPLHGWLPSAMVAPTPVSALLHAVAVVKAGAFCVLRVVCYVFGPESASWCGGAQILSWFAVGTIILSSLIAIRQDNLKARLAFSTVGQLSYIVLGISLLSVYSIAGSLFHIVAHALLKITLFMCAGAIFVTTGLSEISTMGALRKKMPLTSLCFGAASLGIAGMPLMVGFISKFNIIEGAFVMGKPFAIITLVAAALLALSYLIPVVQIFFGKESEIPETLGHHGHEQKGFDAAPAMLIPLTITIIMAVILGFEPNAGAHLYDIALAAAEEITGEGGAYLAK